MQNRKYQIWLPLLFALVLIGGMFIGYKLSRDRIGVAFFKNEKVSPLEEIMGLVDKDYVDPINMNKLQQNSIQSLLSNLDPHSVYITPAQLTKINEEMSGKFNGIGVEYEIKSDTAIILNVLKDGPSDKAGLQKGDHLITANGTIKLIGKDFTSDSVAQRISDIKGDPISLSVLRDHKPVTLQVKRGVIPIPSLAAAYMITPNTGYIKIVRFSEATYPEFMVALEKLQKAKMTQLVLDLRGNGGGELDQAVHIADEFLSDNKLVVYTQGSKIGRSDFICKRDGIFEKGKLAVLVDEESASASEVLAGAMQDWDRAIIIGRRTFGKGLVQEQYSLSNGGALRLTVARYFTPLGRCLQKPYGNGIEAYEDEISNRFKKGEFFHGDTSHNRGKQYKTPKGKIVFDGGGITPDIFIPFDSTIWPHPVVALYAKGWFNDFSLDYYEAHLAQLQHYKTPLELSQQYHADLEEWTALVQYAQRKGIDIQTIHAEAKQNLLNELKANLAKLQWYSEGYYVVHNQYDKNVQAALQYFNSVK